MRGGVASFIVAALLNAAATAALAAAGWVSIPPDGADTSAIAFSRSEPGVVWAGTADGLVRSEDGGVSWAAAGLAGFAIGPVAVHPDDGRQVWAASSGPAVWHSDDGGATFARTDLEPAVGSVQDLALDVSDPGTAYLVGDSRMRITHDGGVTWTNVGAPQNQVWYGTVLATPGGVFAANRTGLYRSTDHGGSWTMAGLAPANQAGSFAADASGLRLWMVSYSLTNPLLYTSSDGGHVWSQAIGVLPDSTHPTGPVAVSPDGGTVFVNAGGRWFASSDGGTVWAERGTPPSACAGASRLVFDPLGQERLLALVGGGIARSTDGGWTWACACRGMRNVTVTALLPAADGSLWTATRDQGIFRSADGGASWAYAGGSVPHGYIVGPEYSYYFTVGALAAIGGRTLAGTIDGAYASMDAGISWQLLEDVHGDVGAFLLDPGRPGTVVATALVSGMMPGGLFVSHDEGATWHQQIRNGTVAGIAADPVRGALLASVRLPADGGLQAFSGIMRSTDHGDTWTQASITAELAMLVADPRVPGRVWAANGRIQFSDDGGTSWQETASPTPCGPGSSLCGAFFLLVDVANDRLLAVAYTWVYESLDDASTWQPLAPAVPFLSPQGARWPDLHLTSVLALGIDASGRLLAGTGGRGLFVLEPDVRVPRRRLSR
ncbi:MAG: hypothetical protein HY825_13810 [Acidobacteria bacterium]|nr:hypothetical protein [Acidobacteriota bacterium]